MWEKHTENAIHRSLIVLPKSQDALWLSDKSFDLILGESPCLGRYVGQQPGGRSNKDSDTFDPGLNCGQNLRCRRP